MNDKTLTIIAICKGYTKYVKKTSTIACAIKQYVSESAFNKIIIAQCGIAKCIQRNLLDAFYDFIDCCDRPSRHLSAFENLVRQGISIDETIIIILKDVDVMDNGIYINGFSDRFQKIIDGLND